MVASERLSVNILFSFNLNISTSLQESCVEITNNIEVNTPIDQFKFPSSNSSRSASVLLNASSKVYVKYIQALNNNPT